MNLVEISSAGTKLKSNLAAPERAALKTALEAEFKRLEALWFNERPYDSVAFAALKATLAEEEQRQNRLVQEQIAAGLAASANEKAQRLRDRPKRWAALSPLQRALLLTADKMGGRNQAAGRLVAMIADELAVDTAAAEPADSFEPGRWE